MVDVGRCDWFDHSFLCRNPRFFRLGAKPNVSKDADLSAAVTHRTNLTLEVMSRFCGNATSLYAIRTALSPQKCRWLFDTSGTRTNGNRHSSVFGTSVIKPTCLTYAQLFMDLHCIHIYIYIYVYIGRVGMQFARHATACISRESRGS